MDRRRIDRHPGTRAWLAIAFGLLLLFAGPRPLALAAEHSLAGQLLVAAPQMSDPNFSKTVVYLLRHDSSGALGLVINRPMGEAPLERVLALLKGERADASNDSKGDATGDATGEAKGEAKGDAAGKADDPLPIYFGGPVEPYRSFTLHSRDVMPKHSVPLDDDTAFNVEDDVLQALAEDAAPKRLIFVLGYSGWAAGQLEGELDRGDWYVVAPEPDLVFGTEPERMWERAAALVSTEL